MWCGGGECGVGAEWFSSMGFSWKVLFHNFWRRTLSLTRVNNRLSVGSANTNKILPPFNLPTHQPPTASLPASPLHHPALQHVTQRISGNLPATQRHSWFFSLQNWWWCDCIPTDLIIKVRATRCTWWWWGRERKWVDCRFSVRQTQEQRCD